MATLLLSLTKFGKGETVPSVSKILHIKRCNLHPCLPSTCIFRHGLLLLNVPPTRTLIWYRLWTFRSAFWSLYVQCQLHQWRVTLEYDRTCLIINLTRVTRETQRDTYVI